MKYRYEIIDDNNEGDDLKIRRWMIKSQKRYVQEYYNGSNQFTWELESLKQGIDKTDPFSKSFYRTKKWLEKNHPELII